MDSDFKRAEIQKKVGYEMNAVSVLNFLFAMSFIFLVSCKEEFCKDETEKNAEKFQNQMNSIADSLVGDTSIKIISINLPERRSSESIGNNFMDEYFMKKIIERLKKRGSLKEAEILSKEFEKMKLEQQEIKEERQKKELNASLAIFDDSFEIWENDSSIFKSSSIDELGKTLKKLHAENILKENADLITIIPQNETDIETIVGVVDKANESGFSKLSFAKTAGRENYAKKDLAGKHHSADNFFSIPKSSSQEKLKKDILNINIFVTKSEIFIDGVPVANTTVVADQDELAIKEINKIFEQKRKQMPNKDESSRVIVWLDSRVNYDVMYKITATCGMSGFVYIAFAVAPLTA